MVKEYQLPYHWWERYDYQSFPMMYRNMHFLSVWNRATDHQRQVARMAIGFMRTPVSFVAKPMFKELVVEFEREGIYLPFDYIGYRRGRPKTSSVLIAAVMEVFTPTGIFSRKV